MRTLLAALSCLAVACGSAPVATGPDFEVVEGKPAGDDPTDGRDDDDDVSVARTDRQAGDPAPVDRAPPATSAAAETEREGTYVVVDGKEATITKTELVPFDDKRNIVTFTIQGTSIPADSEVKLLLQKTTAGCVVAGSTSQGVLYFLGQTARQYRSQDGAACGLDVTAYATKKGEVTKGKFQGVLEGIGDEAGQRHEVALGFEVVRQSDPPPPPPCVKTGFSPGSGSCCSGKAAYQGSMLVCL